MNRNDYSKMVGMSEEDAIDKLQEVGVQFRVTCEDGKHFIGTCDYRPDRVNLVINKGHVTSISFG